MQHSLGTIGAGQLSQMLVQAGTRIGCKVSVLASSSTEPAAKEPDVDLTIGTVSDREVLTSFLKKIPVCGFESELVDCGALKRAASGLGVRFIPGLEVMQRLSEKLEQKRILRNLEIPTASFVEFSGDATELDAWFESLKGRFGPSFVVKWSKFGYDGRGVLLVTDDSSLSKAKASAKVALARGVQLYAETRVAFTRELAMIACQSTTGDFATYPLVISEQEHGVCRRVRGPAISLGVNERFERLAVQYAEKLAKSLPLMGSFGIELFETPEGDLWVNEIAPRVHNSGHYTQDACLTGSGDQFENHLRALTGQMLAGTRTRPFFAMLNLLGPPGAHGRVKTPLPKPPRGVVLHWYNKDELFPGRKLGHLNCVAETNEQLTSQVALMENYERQWAQEISS